MKGKTRDNQLIFLSQSSCGNHFFNFVNYFLKLVNEKLQLRDCTSNKYLNGLKKKNTFQTLCKRWHWECLCIIHTLTVNTVINMWIYHISFCVCVSVVIINIQFHSITKLSNIIFIIVESNNS